MVLYDSTGVRVVREMGNTEENFHNTVEGTGNTFSDFRKTVEEILRI